MSPLPHPEGEGGDERLAILVLSCDKYSDLWEPFLQQFRRHFPVEGARIYLGSNTAACPDPGVTPVLSGPDRDWSTSFARILDQIPERKLFVILEDLFLASHVDARTIEACTAWLFQRNALHIKYWASPAPETPTEQPLIGVYPRGAPYRATVCGFWDRAYLRSLLIPGESPWDFEIQGSYRASYADGIYGLRLPLCSYRNMIEKGCWIPASVEWARSAGVQLRLDRRPLLRGGSRLASRLKMLYFDLMLRVPWRWRVALMDKLRRALISY
jgi:hypothetical protein